MDVLESLEKIGLVPLAAVDRAEDAVGLAKALKAGGIGTVEITFRTECAAEAIRQVKRKTSDFLVGAGTVIDPDQAAKAVRAGADYIVMPGFDDAVVDWCIENHVPVIPGCVTPSEIMKAISKGLSVVKFFPAESCGGVKACASLAAPFGSVRFLVTGGIGPGNLSEYAKKDFIHSIGGSWLCSKEAVKAKNWDKITETAKEAVVQLLGFEVVHVGINTKSPDEAAGISKDLADTFGFPRFVNSASTFVGTGFEINHSAGLGSNGHVAVDTNSVSRAEYYLTAHAGVAFDDASRVKSGGKTTVVYLKKEFGGFAVHLRQRK